jgi:D-sedoheptulose 7-phosphate isomerase
MCLGIPGQVLEIVDDENNIAKVDVSGVRRNVNVTLVRPDGLRHGRSLYRRTGDAAAQQDRVARFADDERWTMIGGLALTPSEPQLKTKNSRLKTLVEERFERSIAVPEAFFASEAGRIAEACWAMARRFHRGGRLLAFGNGAAATDAQHIAVEFVHPVIVGKRALPALALTNDSAALRLPPCGASGGISFEGRLAALARADDMAVGFSTFGDDANVLDALRKAHGMGLLTLGLTGGDGGEMARVGLDYCFVVPSGDPFAIQETHETLYHVWWELVHVFFEHEGLLQ